MKVLIVYVSIHHRNTERVARAMADVLNAEMVQVSEASAGLVEEYDVIGFGSGIYFGRHHGSLLGFVDDLPVCKDKKAFVFSTSGLGRIRIIHEFDRPLRQALRRKGFHVIGEFSCRGYDTYGLTRLVGGINKGRPSARDLEQAEHFAAALRDRISSRFV